MGRAIWANLTVVFAGLAALAGVIWFVAPLLQILGFAPFDSELARILTIVAATLGGVGYFAHTTMQQLKSARTMESAVATPEETDDTDVLKDRMKDALTTLKSASGGRSTFLYDLPWYIIIGPPGSGKTTALVNSGLNFPLARGKTPQAIAGVGGTRYCDYWFTEDAVLIDTAGRYTTQDSNQRSDQKSWLGFLDILKKARPRQPINGVIIAISVQDLMTLDQAELIAHAGAVRSRLVELHERLKVDYPVYVMFTKMDMVAGFIEYFGWLTEAQRRMVWGATFQGAGKTENLVAKVPEEFDALVERLTELMPDRLQGEPDPAGRVRIFGFPAQVATLKAPINDFLTRVFEPTRYHANAILRGFYFTSGTQEGTPIDRIIGSLSRSFGAENVRDGFLSGGGRSYFLNDLVQRVIIGEAAWVSTDRSAVRRNLILSVAGYAALALVLAIGTALWTVSYTRNDKLIIGTQAAVGDYKGGAGPLLAEKRVADHQFERILPLIETIRTMPVGYEFREEPTPVMETFGLSQRERLTVAAGTSYRGALEQFLRPRLLFRLESVINTARQDFQRADKSSLYEAFKVYLMLGGQGPVDKDLIIDWVRTDWARDLYPGPERDSMRDALEKHLVALLDLDTGTGQMATLDGNLVKDVQEKLVQLNLADRAYQILKSRARGGTIRDWVLGRAGSGMASVFEASNNRSLDQIRVPGFYTYNGFYEGLIDRLPDIAGQLERDRWVLGEAGKQSVVADQFTTLPDDILAIYTKDFIAAWTAALNGIRLKPLTADRPKYLTLAALSSAASPLKQIFEEVKTQTLLSRERPPKPAPAPGAANAVATAAAAVLPPKPPVVFAGGVAPTKAIEDFFRGYYAMVEGNAGARVVDEFVGTLNEVYQGLVGTATESGPINQLTAGTRESLRTMRAASARFPAPFDRLLRAASDEFESSVATTIMAELQRDLAQNVTRVCRDTITGRYPFARGTDREVPIADFTRLFAPGGVMDKFFTASLQPYVDTSKPEWAARKDTRVGAMLSNAGIREFQRAAQIKDAFFGAGATQAGFAFAIQAITPTAFGTTVRLEINGTQIASPQAPAPLDPLALNPTPAAPPQQPGPPVMVNWPGPVGLGAVKLTATSDTAGTVFPLMERTGTWALFRVLDQSKLARQGDRLRLTLSASGREFGYNINVASIVNPLTMTALKDFNCPATLQ